jgi:hypothetical protein
MVWTEEVMFDVRLEKKALPEDGADEMGLLLILVAVALLSVLTLIFMSLSLELLLVTPPILPPPRAEFANEPIPPITAVHGLLKLEAFVLVVVGGTADADGSPSNSDSDTAGNVAVAAAAAASPSLP